MLLKASVRSPSSSAGWILIFWSKFPAAMAETPLTSNPMGLMRIVTKTTMTEDADEEKGRRGQEDRDRHVAHHPGDGVLVHPDMDFADLDLLSLRVQLHRGRDVIKGPFLDW